MKKIILLIGISLLTYTMLNAQSWQTVGGNVDSFVWDMYSDTSQDQLYVTGAFKDINGQPLNGIAKWNDFSWDSVGIHNETIYSVFKFNDTLYAHGKSPIYPALSSTLMKWNGSQWIPLISSISGSHGTPRIYEHIIYNNAIYLCGNFDTINSIAADKFIKFDGTSFSAVNITAYSTPANLTVHNNHLYYSFHSTNTNGSVIWRYNGTSSFPSMTNIRFYIEDMESHNGLLIAGGYGGNLIGSNNPTPPYLLSLTGTSNWSTNINLPTNATTFTSHRKVRCLKSHGSTLYIGTDSQPFIQGNIYKSENNGQISIVAGGVNDGVRNIEIFNQNVYISGIFTQAGNNNVSYLAKLTHQSPRANFSINNGNSSICEGNSVVYNDNSSFSNSYQWLFQGGTPNISTSKNPTITYNAAGTYDVQLIVNGLGGIDTIYRTNYITVNPPLPIPLVTLLNGLLSTNSAATSYQWYVNGSPINGANNPTLIPQSNGNYTVKINHNGCSAISAAVSVNTVGIDDLNTPYFETYPNPASNFLTVRTSNVLDYYIITDLFGKEIKKGDFDQNKLLIIDVSSLSDGIYFIHSVTGAKRSIKKFIKH